MGLRPRLDALSRWLMWQGLSADVRVEETRIDIADTMLSRAADMNVDLIAMGASATRIGPNASSAVPRADCWPRRPCRC